ncbi:MAG: gliding motility-associated ABC transporter permease subunit GldF, partial [Bacteroidota bacterium]
AIVGSYIGLFFLSATFISIGLFASALSKNQIVAFVLAAFLCFFLYYGFYFLSKLPVFTGKADLLIQNLGIDYHYESISRGVLDTRDIIYFLSVIAFFLGITMLTLESRKQ